MYQKSISVILVIAFLNLLGCAATQSFTVSEYKQSEDRNKKPDEICVIIKTGQEYYFSEPILLFQHDTLKVNGILKSDPGQRVERNFAVSEIESIQSKSMLMSGSSFLIVLGICGGIYLILYAIASTTMKWGS